MDDSDLEDDLLFDDDSHAFGGAWTLLKLDLVHKYLCAFTSALKNQNFELHYIDAFAGNGRCDIVDGGDRVPVDGSAPRALAVNPAFRRFTFIEKKAKNLRALKLLKEAHPDRRIDVIKGDANGVLAAICRAEKWRRQRAVIFLDPFGMNVDWQTLREIASTEAIDVWYLFPLSGVVRQAARDPKSVDAKKAASLTRTLGTDEWRTAWYRPKPQLLLFDVGVQEERHFDHNQITHWVTARLGSVFPGVEGPLILRSNRGAPLFALYFLVSNPRPTAQKLARRMARDILQSAA